MEGWDRPDYDDSAWAEQSFGQEPPSPTLLGQQTPAQNLLAGALWARARLTLADPQASRQWLVPSEAPQAVTLLDGKPLRQKAELRALSAGPHVVALRIWPPHAIVHQSNYNPWGQKPTKLPWPAVGSEPVSAAAVSEPKEKMKVPSTQRARAAMQPAAITVPAAERLAGVWYRRDDPAHQALAQGWPTALAGDAPPAGWTPIAPDADEGTVAGLPDECSHWFAAPFVVSEAEARGPARLLIDTTGGTVPTDVVKTLWVNGQPVHERIEFVSTQRYEQGNQGRETGKRRQADDHQFHPIGAAQDGTQLALLPRRPPESVRDADGYACRDGLVRAVAEVGLLRSTGCGCLGSTAGAA